MLERARLDLARLDEEVQVRHLDADHAAKSVRLQAPFADQSVKGLRRDAQELGGLCRANPFRAFAHSFDGTCGWVCRHGPADSAGDRTAITHRASSRDPAFRLTVGIG